MKGTKNALPNRVQREQELDELRVKGLANNLRQKFEDDANEPLFPSRSTQSFITTTSATRVSTRERRSFPETMKRNRALSSPRSNGRLSHDAYFNKHPHDEQENYYDQQLQWELQQETREDVEMERYDEQNIRELTEVSTGSYLPQRRLYKSEEPRINYTDRSQMNYVSEEHRLNYADHYNVGLDTCSTSCSDPENNPYVYTYDRRRDDLDSIASTVSSITFEPISALPDRRFQPNSSKAVVVVPSKEEEDSAQILDIKTHEEDIRMDPPNNNADEERIVREFERHTTGSRDGIDEETIEAQNRETLPVSFAEEQRYVESEKHGQFGAGEQEFLEIKDATDYFGALEEQNAISSNVAEENEHQVERIQTKTGHCHTVEQTAPDFEMTTSIPDETSKNLPINSINRTPEASTTYEEENNQFNDASYVDMRTGMSPFHIAVQKVYEQSSADAFCNVQEETAASENQASNEKFEENDKSLVHIPSKSDDSKVDDSDSTHRPTLHCTSTVSLSSDDAQRSLSSASDFKSNQRRFHQKYGVHANPLGRQRDNFSQPPWHRVWCYSHVKEVKEEEEALRNWQTETSSMASDDSQNSSRGCLLLLAMLITLSIGATGVILLVSVAPRTDVVNSRPGGSVIDDAVDSLSRFETFRLLFGSLYGFDTVDDFSSPQYAAVHWLSNEDPAELQLSTADPTVLIQRYVAALLYFATNGDAWLQSFNFLSSSSVCQWNGLRMNEHVYPSDDGIVCDERNYVVQIILAENNLSGNLPWEVFTLESLEVLYLPANNLNGTIPTQLEMLTNFRHLDLVSNAIHGSIPPEIGSQEHLQHLNVGSNKITGSLPTDLGNLNRLQVLGVGDNNIEGGLPSELGRLSDLRFFSTDSNRIVGSIPTELGKLNKLQVLDLGDNKLSGRLPSELGLVSDLTYLSVCANRLNGAIPAEIGKLRLRSLNVRSNDLTGNLDADFCGGTYKEFWADCGGIAPEIVCSCCTNCCDDFTCCDNDTQCCVIDESSKQCEYPSP